MDLESFWIRDTGPVFVLGEARRLRGVDLGLKHGGRKLPLASGIGLPSFVLSMSDALKNRCKNSRL